MLALNAALPAWKQSQTTLPDGSLDPQWFNDCGETCLGMAIAALRGTPIGAGSIRANLGGIQRSGLTNGSDLVRAAAYYNVLATVEPVAPGDLELWLTNWSNAHQPSIVLGTWPTPGGVLHWMLTQSGGDRWYYVNPWSGGRSWLDWADVLPLYAGELVAIREPVAYDMYHVATPF